MWKKKQVLALDYQRKNRRKIWKTIVQIVLLAMVALLLVNNLVPIKKYEEPIRSHWSNKEGFIALSYFGVSYSKMPRQVAKSQLEAQLKALYDQGYVTISQQDIIDFYHHGQPLPEKALFLSFEDGRADTSLFAQPLLEKYNYKATFFSYANKVGSGERNFVQPKEMLKMKKSGYWELGTSGNRLTYINIVNHQGQFLGMRDEGKLSEKEQISYYNHYLMDFIRDENMIPVENRTVMEQRIREDYDVMRQFYEQKLGFVPATYMIMHANALYNGMNPLVEKVNDENIKQIFRMHFNREGEALNTDKDNIYDLTRVQVAPYWSTNHLLMKIMKDTGQQVKFVQGDEALASAWTLVRGAAEFSQNRIIVTSPPGEAGQLYLNDSESSRDVSLALTLSGNIVGQQSVYLRYNLLADSFLRITLENNKLYIEEKTTGRAVRRLLVQELSSPSGSMDGGFINKASIYTIEQILAEVNEQPLYPVHVSQTRKLKLELKKDLLSVWVDGTLIGDSLPVNRSLFHGGIALEARYSKENKRDDIYDGIFEDIEVMLTGEEDVALEGSKESDQTLLVSNRLRGWHKAYYKLSEGMHSAISWVMDTF